MFCSESAKYHQMVSEKEVGDLTVAVIRHTRHRDQRQELDAVFGAGKLSNMHDFDTIFKWLKIT